MGAVGDPRADVGYLLATYSEPGGDVNPLGASPGDGDAPASRRSRSSSSITRSGAGASVEPLAWFQALALWKAAVFCEAIYGRYVRGELAAEDCNARPLRARRAAARAHGARAQGSRMRRRLYLMRHGDVSYFDDDGHPHRPDDVGLTEDGERQARRRRRRSAGSHSTACSRAT